MGAGALTAMKINIRPMTTIHLPRVSALEKICFPDEAWSENLFREALDCPNTAILLAEGEDKTLLGYAVLSLILDEGNLDNIAVAPEYRRQGVADALLTVLTGFCRGEHIARLMLEVRASNTPAISLYHKYGFEAVGRRKHYYEKPREDAVLMTLEFYEQEEPCSFSH